ncbi:MAG: TRAP transporter substrate-binding protein DctP, partial [bacterium]
MAAKELRLASEAGAKGSPVANSMDLWGELIGKNSDGELTVNVFYQGELGGQQELFDQLVKGNVDMMLTWPITSYDPRMGVINTPYLVLDWDDALEAYKPGGWLAEIVDPVFQDVGLKYFGPYPEGFAGVATKGRYATTAEAAKGIKVRSQPIFPFPQSM